MIKTDPLSMHAMLPRRSVFRNLLLSMIAFGVLVGLIFPPFARLVLHSERALSPTFFAMCVAAGFLVGLVNYLLFRVVVSRQLARLVAGMQHVLESVVTAEHTGEGCGEECKLEVTSNDAIGEIEITFNEMTEAIARRLTLEEASRCLHAQLSTSVELEDVARILLATLVDLEGAKAGLLYGDIGGALELLASQGVDRHEDLPRTLNKDLGPVDQAHRSGEVLSLSPRQDGLEWIISSTPLGSFRPEHILVIPLMENQRPVGLAITATHNDKLTPVRTQILESLRTQGAPYLQNAILHRKLKNLAALDDLTMLLNRRFGLRRLQEEFSRSVRHGVPVSVLMMDVDHFKDFNDTFGHDAGDVVLKEIAAALEANLRSGDVACRYGGEEFMIVAPGTGLNDAVAIAERLRRLIETRQIPWGQQALAVTVSIGLATWPIERASAPTELVTAADRALYFAKESGRNQVAVTRDDQVHLATALETHPDQA